MNTRLQVPLLPISTVANPLIWLALVNHLSKPKNVSYTCPYINRLLKSCSHRSARYLAQHYLGFFQMLLHDWSLWIDDKITSQVKYVPTSVGVIQGTRHRYNLRVPAICSSYLLVNHGVSSSCGVIKNMLYHQMKSCSKRFVLVFLFEASFGGKLTFLQITGHHEQWVS